jgi:hypothetical protein
VTGGPVSSGFLKPCFTGAVPFQPVTILLARDIIADSLHATHHQVLVCRRLRTQPL